MLKTKIESKINTYDENTFELTHKSRFGIFIDGNEATYKHLKNIDQNFRNMTESTEKLKKNLIDELEIYLNSNKLGDRCELCDMNDSRSYFSVEYPMLIYVVPGVTGIIQNKGSEKKRHFALMHMKMSDINFVSIFVFMILYKIKNRGIKLQIFFYFQILHTKIS